MQNEDGGFENDCSIARLAVNHYMLTSPSIQQMRSYAWMKSHLPKDKSIHLQDVTSLYTTLGCLACHSTDGTRGHGPTFSGLYGAERTFAGGIDPQKADEAYLKESISHPLAKVVEGFPPGYMPPYALEDKQVKSLLLFIRSLQDE